MEVFIGYTKGTDIARLEQTLEAWDLPGLEPAAIQCGLRKFDIHRRVAAENVSRGTYVLSLLGFGPVEESFADLAAQALAENPKAGMIEVPNVTPVNPLAGGILHVDVPVVVCRKGLITHWVQPLSEREELWENAHRTSYRNAGYEVISCPLIHFQALAVSLPSSSGTAKQN